MSIASRVLYFTIDGDSDREIRIEIDLPFIEKKNGGSIWKCKAHIKGIKKPDSVYAYGEDAIQALIGAIFLVGQIITYSEEALLINRTDPRNLFANFKNFGFPTSNELIEIGE